MKKIFVSNFSVGDSHVVAVSKNNKVYCWGGNSNFQISKQLYSRCKFISTPTQLKIPNVKNHILTKYQVKCG